MTKSSLADRAAAGAAHLDSIEPEWFDRVDLNKLDMGKGWKDTPEDTGCVLCQLSSIVSGTTDAIQVYGRGQKEFSVDEINENDLGFYLYEPVNSHNYRILTACWRNEILKRRGLRPNT